MTFYLKYRPKNLDELDSVEVASALKKIVISGSIPHAFLFSGPKGTGKTSAARILAKIINCENVSKQGMPCDKCEQCVSTKKSTNLDVVELDAASHRGIDDIRLLKDAVKLSPAKAKKKIYIIDEAHMLTTEASNALLKTLEEPPDHVVFVLATTNPEKLIDTIRSRTTVITFKKAKNSEIVNSLKRVVKGEGIKIDEDALNTIAEASGGAFRDAIKTLEQLVIESRDLSKESLENLLFSKKAFDIPVFVKLLVAKDTKKVLAEIERLEVGGIAVENFLITLLAELRLALLAQVGIGSSDVSGLNKDELVKILDLMAQAYRETPQSPIETLPLEMAVIKWCEGINKESQPIVREEKDSHPVQNGVGSGAKTVSAVSNAQAESKDVLQENDAQTISPATHTRIATPSMATLEAVNDDIWKSILAIIKPINASIEALLRAARPIGYDGKVLTLGVYYKFHKERLEDARHRRILEDVVAQVLGSATKVVCTLTEPAPKKIVTEVRVETVLTEGKDADIIKVAEEIFGN